MYKTLKFRITGKRPLLMHNGALADPLNQITKEIKKISNKRGKTEADLVQMSKLEFQGGLWLSDGKPCIPSVVLESCLAEAAKRMKLGKQAKAGMIVYNDALLEYDGSKNIEELWEDPNYRLICGVNVQRNKIMRTRPKFEKWATEFSVDYEDTVLNESQVREIVKTAGMMVGLGDWRPRFGLFDVELV